MTTTTSTVTDLPLPYSPGGSPWAGDKTVARIRGFLRRYIGLGLTVPDDVTDALAAFQRLSAWLAQPRPDAQQARDTYRAALTAAARDAKTKPPSIDPVIAAVARTDAHRVIARDLQRVSESMHADVIGAVRHHIDDMLTALQIEHDELIAAARDHANQLPASVTNAEQAVAAGPAAAAAWLALSDIGQRIRAVRGCRLKIADVDHPPKSGDYIGYRHPERFPSDETVTTAPHAVVMLDMLHDRHRAEPWCPTRTQLAEHVAAERAAGARRRQGPESAMGQYKVAAGWPR